MVIGNSEQLLIYGLLQFIVTIYDSMYLFLRMYALKMQIGPVAKRRLY